MSILGWTEELFFIKNEETLRVEPQGRVITKLPQNTQVEVLASNDNWVKVKVEGWISKDALSDNFNDSPDNESQIDPGFTYSQLKLKGNNGQIRISGHLKNKTGNDYQITTFMIKLYNSSGTVIGSKHITLHNFNHNETQSFTISLAGFISQVDNYKIEFTNGI